MHARLEQIDLRIAYWMRHTGHRIDRFLLGAVFIWFGMLKVFGYNSATSIIAKTVYLGSPETTVPLLGLWEATMGLCLVVRPLMRVALLLLFIRLPGTLLALALRPEVCFDGSILLPTIQGQYLMKDFILVGTALILGGTVRKQGGAPAAGQR